MIYPFTEEVTSCVSPLTVGNVYTYPWTPTWTPADTTFTRTDTSITITDSNVKIRKCTNGFIVDKSGSEYVFGTMKKLLAFIEKELTTEGK